MVSHSPAQAVQHTQLALKHALTGQPGPVAVVYHSSALQGRVGPTSLPRIYPTDAYLPAPSRGVDEETLDAAARSRPRRRPARSSSPATASAWPTPRTAWSDWPGRSTPRSPPRRAGRACFRSGIPSPSG